MTFRVLYVFVILRHNRRQVVHFNVTVNPYARWTAQQIITDYFEYYHDHICLWIATHRRRAK